jgi:two-component system response regulator PilR (NtrC family)
MSKIVIVDDEMKITQLLSERIEDEGHSVTTFSSAEEALPFIERNDTDIVLCDLRLGGMSGLELLTRAKRVAPTTDFVMMTAYASANTAVEAMREGAYEYLIKPFQMEEVILLLRRIQDRRDLVSENRALRERISDAATARRIVGESPAIKRIREMIFKVGPSGAPVLVQGESGTGKELVAAEIHMSSARSKNPFIVINCAAVPETLIESELFGFEKGAFTGASQRKPGMFKLADTGTLFLDEIGDLSLGLQAKLLRAIEAGEFIPLGASKPVKVDVRIVAATNQDLEELAGAGRFREDLFYRLNVFPIRIQPLRERREDIIPITESFLKSWNLSSNALSRDVHEKLMNYDWPGNVRELRNILERAVILAGQEVIRPEHITITDSRSANLPEDRLRSIVGERTLPEIEKIMIELALERTGGNKSRAAELLGITRRTLYGRLEKLEEEKESAE